MSGSGSLSVETLAAKLREEPALEERRTKIVDLVDAEGQITFAQLKTAFPNVSEMTLRTDLKHLHEAGRIVRVHGGARSVEIAAGSEDYFSKRAQRNRAQKQVIAEKAAALLQAHHAVFLDSGSTATQLARYIPDEPREIFTSGLSCAAELSNLSQPTIHMLGGTLNRYSLSVQGSRSTAEALGRRYNICFLGVTGFNPSDGFCCENEEDCLLKQAVIRQSDTVVVLMDSRKYGQYNTYSICQCDAVHYVVSDSQLAPEYRAHLESHGITVL